VRRDKTRFRGLKPVNNFDQYLVNEMNI